MQSRKLKFWRRNIDQDFITMAVNFSLLLSNNSTMLSRIAVFSREYHPNSPALLTSHLPRMDTLSRIVDYTVSGTKDVFCFIHLVCKKSNFF